MNVAETTLPAKAVKRFSAPRLAHADVRSGFGLVGLIFVYAVIIDLLGRPRPQQLLITIGNFAGLSLYAGILVASMFALLCLIRPDLRTDIQTRIFWLGIACALTALV